MKRVTRMFLFCVVVFAGVYGSACTTSPSPAPAGDARDMNSLTTLYRDAIRTPLTPYIVNQIRDEHKENLFQEIPYYSSVNIAVIREQPGVSLLDLETQELRRAEGAQEVPVLTFREGASLEDQSRISREDEGQLRRLSPAGDIFEIRYPERQIILGFVLNPEDQRYDLEFAIDGEGEERIPLSVTGVRPHLMINYRTVFPVTGETRIQLTGKPGPAAGESSESDPPPPEPGENSGEAFDEGGPQSYRPPGDSAGLAWGPEEPAGDSGPVPPPPEEDFWPQALGDPAYDDGAEAFPDPGAFYGEEEALAWDYPVEEDGLYPAEEPPYLVEEPVTDAVLQGGRDGVPWQDEPPLSLERVLVEDGDGSYEPEVVFVESPGKPANPGVTADEYRNPGPSYCVQVGAFRDKKNAAAAYAILEQGGFSPRYEDYRDLTRVVLPAVEQKELARTRDRIKALGFGDPYVRP
jgi:hypothetical protein